MANRVVRVNVQKIKEMAEMKDMNLKQLEEVAGISNGVIARWVSADARVDKLYRVADVLGTNVNHLLEKV